MAKSTTLIAAFAATAGLLAVCGTAFGQVSTGRTPTPTDLDFCNHEAETSAAGSASPSSTATGSLGGSSVSGATGAAGATGGTGPLSGGSTLGSSGATTGGDLQARGTAGSAATDPAFQQAFRSCLQRRGF